MGGAAAPLPSTVGPSARVTALELALALVAIAIAVAPFVVPEIPVGTDLPKHVFVGHVLAHFNDPQLAYSRHFELIYRPRSTVLGELTLAGIMKFLPPFAAAKAYLIMVALSLWLTGRYLVVQMGKPPIAALLFLPVLHSFPLFSGFLPYSASVALFPLLLGTLIRHPPGRSRAIRVGALLVLLYGFHIVAVSMGCLLTLIFAMNETGMFLPLARRVSAASEDFLRAARGSGMTNALWGLASIVPGAGLVVYFILQKDALTPQFSYQWPLRQVKTYLAYNVGGLSKTASYFLLAGIVLLAAAGWHGARRRLVDVRLLVFACASVVLGVCMPMQVGDWFVVGSRTFPFALFAAVGLPAFNLANWKRAVAVAFSVLCITSSMNTRVAVDVQPLYRTFLSGLPQVAYGSRVLPLIENLAQGGNVFVAPFNGIEDAYNIFRGGSNAYVFAYPSVVTGAFPIRMTWKPTFAYKFDGARDFDYHGVGEVYDYVVLWGNVPGAQRQFDTELDLTFQNGALRLYRSRTRQPPR